jgi:TonB family protein
VTRFPDFLPGPKEPISTPRSATPAHRVSVAYAPGNGSASPLILQPDWVAKPSAEDVARVYPKADQDRLGGTAALDCRFAEDGHLSACRVAAETPPGDGFGAAALKLAALFRAKPTSRDGVAVAGGAVRIPIRFISPDRPASGLVDATTVITHPVWLEKPGPADIARLYPPQAARQGLEARVTMRCLVDPDGHLAECGVARPADGAAPLPRDIAMDFGTATLQLAKRFRMAAKTSDGTATAGAVINIPVIWQRPRQAEPSGPSARAVVQPRWTRIPTAAELARYYPPEAQKQNMEGMTTLSCGVDRQGQLFDCTASEPSGFGKTPAMREDFRKATLDLVPLFRMQPQMVGGRPTDGGRVVIPIRWSLPTDPAAKAALDGLRDPGAARPSV